mgnify:FL=1
MHPAGPLYHYAMWRPEGKWGEMACDLKNKRRPESNMIGRIMDKEVVGLWELSQHQGRHSRAELVVKAEWGAHDLLRSSSPSIKAVPAAMGALSHLERLSLRRRYQQEMLKHLFKMYWALMRSCIICGLVGLSLSV